jgi:hypothetical protein
VVCSVQPGIAGQTEALLEACVETMCCGGF